MMLLKVIADLLHQMKLKGHRTQLIGHQGLRDVRAKGGGFGHQAGPIHRGGRIGSRIF